jgi:hypothetical protein
LKNKEGKTGIKTKIEALQKMKNKNRINCLEKNWKNRK